VAAKQNVCQTPHPAQLRDSAHNKPSPGRTQPAYLCHTELRQKKQAAAKAFSKTR
jgi:hypothetical protein